MNAESFLGHYERIAEAPDAISRMRRFILELAVRGKLVPQDAGDEPASELLKRIACEKARLVTVGEIKKAKPIGLPEGVEVAVPLGWRVVPLGEIVNRHLGGGTPSKGNYSYWGGDIRWASVKDVGKTKYLDETIDRITEAGLANSSSNLIPQGNLLVVTRMGLGQLSINRVPVAINQDLRALFVSPFVDIDFVYNFFLTYGMEGTGLTVKGIKIEELLGIPFPLPPLAEQQRIVAKVDELMDLCDRLEAARSAREEARDRLAAASLARLNAPDPETFQVEARFALDALPALTARPDQIKALRQTILNLAVRGKLVGQNPADEPASDLLKRIASAKAAIGEHRVSRARDQKAAIMPSGTADGHRWESVRLDAISIFENGDRSSNYPSGPDIKSDGIPFFSTKNLSDHRLRFADLDFISPEKFKSLRSGKLKNLDILITLRGSVGKFGLFEASDQITTGFINAQLLIIRCIDLEIVPYLVTYMKSDGFAQQIAQLSSGAATPQLSAGKLAEALIPLPPLAEQRRIVAKVTELMTLCDQLEVSLSGTVATRRCLLDALLAEALAPVPVEEAV